MPENLKDIDSSMRNIGLIMGMNENVVIKSYLYQFLSNKRYLRVILPMKMFEQEYRSFFKKQLGIIEDGSFSFENDSVTVTYNPDNLDHFHLETVDLRNDPEPTKEHMLNAIQTNRPFLVKMKVTYYDEHVMPFVDGLARQHYPDLKLTISDEMAVISYMNGYLGSEGSKPYHDDQFSQVPNYSFRPRILLGE